MISILECILPGPQGLGLVEHFPVPNSLLDFLGLGLVVLAFVILDLSVLIVGGILLLLGSGLLVNRHLLFNSFACPQVDGEVDELRVFLDQVLDGFGLQIVTSLGFQFQTDLGTTLKGAAPGVLGDAKAGSVALPNVLLVLVILARHHDSVGD